MNTQEKGSAIRLLFSEYIESYAQSKGKMQVNAWFAQELHMHMPDKSSGEITRISREITVSLNIQQEKAQSLMEATSQGKSKEKWFADEMKSLMSDLPESEQKERMTQLGQAVANTKSELAAAITGSSPENAKVYAAPREIASEISNTAVMGQLVADDAILSSSSSAETGSPAAQEIIKEELQSGNDLGLKAAVAGASYTAAEKGLIEVPKENRSEICASIGQSIVEKAKVAGGFVSKTIGEGVNFLERSAVSNVVGVATALKGTAVAVSAAITGVLAPVILYTVGKELGDRAVRYVHKERPALVRKTVEVLKKGAEVAGNAAKNLGKSV